MPTLFDKGNLRYVPGGLKQDELNEIKPLDYIMQWFEKRMQGKNTSSADRVLILLSETGSGKSTVLPPTFYKLFFEKTSRRNIACTQPRILTALQIPREVETFNPELKLGENLGYQTSVLTKKPVRGVIYMTTGTLQQQLNVMSDEAFMNKYSVIFLDEIHERSIPMDFTLFAMKKFIQRNYDNPNCPFLVIMSATFNVEKFQNYLLSDVSKSLRNSSVIKVSGLTFPIEVHWPDHDSDNVYSDAAKTTVKIHLENPDDYQDLNKSEKVKTNNKDLQLRENKIEKLKKLQKFRDILIFVGGMTEAKFILEFLNASLETLHKENKPLFKPIIIMGEDVRQNTENYQELDRELDKIRVEIKINKSVKLLPVVRRVFISTNVAETGITINSLKYVIDTGFFKSAENNPNYNMGILAVQPVTHGMWKQRKGRAGRKAPGQAYPLYTQSTYNLLQEDQFPDIIRQNITLELLMMLCTESDPEREFTQEIPRKLLFSQEYLKKIDKTVDLSKLDLLDMPSADSLHYSLDTLFRLGAISKNSRVQPLGILMSRFRQVPVEFLKMLLSAWAWQAPILDIINIIALANTNIKTRNYRPDKILKWAWHNKASVNTATIVQMEIFCDFIELAIIWDFLEQNSLNLNLREFRDTLDSVGLNISAFNTAMETREDILHACMSLGLNPFTEGFDNFSCQIPETLNSWINKIKICIWEGFKTNMLIYNESKHIYENTRGKVEITVPNFYKKYPCKYLLYSSITWIADIRSNKYKCKPGLISAMDGYVNFNEFWDIIIK